jgi:selenide,water dikinase
LPPGDLEQALCGLKLPDSPYLLVGLDQADDAGVYQISEDLALIQTVDFFTPMVDDPYKFGQIAAANALSDVYAMGGVPKTAMNLMGFPIGQMDISIFRKIIQGGLDKIREAGAVLVGGHSVEDKELKYGLSVTGFVHPKRILVKRDLKPNQRLILTKPLGVGIVNTAVKAGLATTELADRTASIMATLNKDAAEVMAHFPVGACTDVTGFGFIGHLSEMVVGSGCSIEIDSGSIPLIHEAIEFAQMGLIPAGAYKNKEFREHMVDIASKVPREIEDILFDPQTSGGLLMAVDTSAAKDLLRSLIEKRVSSVAIVGRVADNGKEKIRIQ